MRKLSKDCVDINVKDLPKILDSILVPYSQKKGRPTSKRNITTKAYKKITISITMQEKEKIKNEADQHYDGNISELIKSLLRDKQII